MSGRSAIFTRRHNGTRKMHAVRPNESNTVCGLPTGIGTGLVRDGDYWNNVPCASCWRADEETAQDIRTIELLGA